MLFRSYRIWCGLRGWHDRERPNQSGSWSGKCCCFLLVCIFGIVRRYCLATFLWEVQLNQTGPSSYVLIICLSAMIVFGLIGAFTARPGPSVPFATWAFQTSMDQTYGGVAGLGESNSSASWNFGSNETCYINGLARVRSAPSGQASLMGELRRGEAVTCRTVTNKGGWYLIDSGTFAGSFMAVNAVSNQPLPKLDTRYSGRFPIRRSGSIFAVADPSSRALQNLSPPMTLTIVGRTENGMFEVRMRSGGAGYVSNDIFRR